MPHVDPTADPLARAVTENAGRLYRLAYSYLKNEQDAMDVVQEAACRLLKNRGSVAPDRAFAWLWRVTVNASLDLLRQASDEELSDKLAISDSRIADLRSAINFLAPVAEPEPRAAEEDTAGAGNSGNAQDGDED